VTAPIDCFPWDVLLASIEEGRVIPVVGPELLVVERDGSDVLFHEQIAAALSKRLGIAGEIGRASCRERVLAMV